MRGAVIISPAFGAGGFISFLFYLGSSVGDEACCLAEASSFRSFRTRKDCAWIETDLDCSGLNSDHVGF